MRATLVTCRAYASPPVSDDLMLMQALSQLGVEVERRAWEEEYDWSWADVAIVRSAWNAHLEPTAYLQWAHNVAAQTVLLNPVHAITWNMEKHTYFRDLESLGVLIPTYLLPQGESVDLMQIMEWSGWNQVVLKPTVGANSFETLLIKGTDPASLVRGESHLSRLLTHKSMLVQPYLSSIETQGEHSHVFLGGRWSHAFCKYPFGVLEPNASLPEQEVWPAYDEQATACRIARAVEERLGGPPLPFMRIDLVRDDDGAWRLMEVEVNEPVLHLEMGDAASVLALLIVAEAMKPRPGQGKGRMSAMTTQEEQRYVGK